MFCRIAAALALTVVAAPMDAQTPAPDYSTAAPSTGGWNWAQVTGGSEATFTDALGQPQVFVRCSLATRRVTISRPATTAAPFLLVWTTGQSRNLPSSYLPASNRLIADLAAYDPLLDSIVFSRGRFAVGVSGQTALVVPAWAEVARVVEDCRA